MHGYHDDYYFIPDDCVELHGAEHDSASATATTRRRTSSTPACCRTRRSSRRGTRGSGCTARPIRTSPGSRACGPRFEDQDTGQITGDITNVGREPQLALRLSGEAVAPDRRGSRGGSHDLKVGIQYVRPRQRQPHRQQRPVSRPTADREADDRHDAAALSRRASTVAVDRHLRRRHATAIGSAVINFGVRYDYSKAMFPGAAVPRCRRASRRGRCRRPTTTSITGTRSRRASASTTR